MKRRNEETGILMKRETFSTSLTVFFATLGSAVGLGNIWKFPYMTGMNGGGAFILVYLLFVLLLGIPIMLSEFYLGRKTRSNVVGVFDKLKAHRFWKTIGYMGLLSALLIMFFYSTVAGWVYAYVFRALRGDFRFLKDLGLEEARTASEGIFTDTLTGVSPMIWQAVAVLVVAVILIGGVKKGIERVTKTLMPVLLLLIIISAVRALTLSGAGEGLAFLMKADFSALTGSSILAAMGLAFFKLSLGMGTMVTYGSYFNKDNNLMGTSFKVAFSDVAVSMLAGLAIFPVVFTFNLAPEGGPGLLFQTIPLVFSMLPFGNVLLTAFFVLTAIASTTAMLSMVEVPIAILTEELKLKRRLAVMLTTSLMFLVGVLTTHPDALFGTVEVAGKNLFDLFDYLSSNLLLPLGGLLITLFVAYFTKKESIREELTNGGEIGNGKFVDVLLFVLKYITPVLLIIVFLNALGILSL
ncbi:MAG: sodium-dependent transporter [Clostridia bacterium]|nr:sodium-dependent transporter [Clostridia bacterium]